ncbi:MAG: thioredoxin [bacterium]|nr:thioredoxin [bacterium]
MSIGDEVSAVKEITDQTFQTEVLQSKIPVLVDCWAEWCAPCRMISPIIERLSQEYNGKFAVYKCNIDSNFQTAVQFGISSIPTLLFFKDGLLVNKLIGAYPKEIIKEKMEEILRKG